METFPNMFNYVTGAFPDVTAKQASGAGNKDGTEWDTPAVDNFMFGWTQALLNKFGKTPNGVTEADGTSQILDTLRMAAFYLEPSTFTTTNTANPGELSRFYTLDTSLGGFTQTISDGAFDGQRVRLKADGVGLAYLVFTGESYALGMPLENHTIDLVWDATASEWTYEDVVVTNYFSGNTNVIQTSKGGHKESGRVSIDGLLNVIVTFIVSFTSKPSRIWTLSSLGGYYRQWYDFSTGGSPTTQARCYLNSAGVTNMYMEYKFEGQYS